MQVFFSAVGTSGSRKVLDLANIVGGVLVHDHIRNFFVVENPIHTAGSDAMKLDSLVARGRRCELGIEHSFVVISSSLHIQLPI